MAGIILRISYRLDWVWRHASALIKSRSNMPTPTLYGYRPRKAAQISALFVRKAGGNMDKLKLIKLLYLTERESIRLRNFPMFYDEHYSIKHGPICSNALNGINGDADSEIWRSYIFLSGRTNVFDAAPDSPIDAGELSESDWNLLVSVANKYLSMSTSQIRDWVHDPKNCPEYTEVSQGRLQISYFDIAEAVGSPFALEIQRDIFDYRRMEAIFHG